MVLMMKCTTHFAHIFAAITNISVVDRYSTVTCPLNVHYSPSNTLIRNSYGLWRMGVATSAISGISRVCFLRLESTATAVTPDDVREK